MTRNFQSPERVSKTAATIFVWMINSLTRPFMTIINALQTFLLRQTSKIIVESRILHHLFRNECETIVIKPFVFSSVHYNQFTRTELNIKQIEVKLELQTLQISLFQLLNCLFSNRIESSESNCIDGTYCQLINQTKDTM